MYREGLVYTRLTGNARKARIPWHFLILRSAVETKNLNRFCKIAIDTQFEKGILTTRLLVRDSPHIYVKRNLRCSS